MAGAHARAKEVSDANGNLATDGGALFTQVDANTLKVEENTKRLDENSEGVAMALALANPDLTGTERFGIMVNGGRFEDANAVGITAVVVAVRDLFGTGTRVSLGGGLGYGLSKQTMGGRVGGQLTW